MKRKRRFFIHAATALAAILSGAACAPAAGVSPADQMATNVAIGVSAAQTRTASAPTAVPSATPTLTPPPPTPTPTRGPLQPPVVVNFAPCWFGPGSRYNLESNINPGEKVELLGVGTVPGWYIIRNPYFFQPCWIQAANLSIDPGTVLSQYPLVTPYPLQIPTP